MAESLFPREGDWYKDSIGRVMQVVAYDESNDAVDVQLFEGEVTEFDFNSWNRYCIDGGSNEICSEGLPEC